MDYDIIIIPLNPTWLFAAWFHPQAYFCFLTIFLFIWFFIFIAIALIRKTHTDHSRQITSSFTYVEIFCSFIIKVHSNNRRVFLPSYYFPAWCLFTQDDRNARCQASINRFTLTLLRSISGGSCGQTEERCN